MRTSLPLIPFEQVPPKVNAYLIREGWTSNIAGTNTYWYPPSSMGVVGFFTWEQALIYAAFDKLNLMV